MSTNLADQYEHAGHLLQAILDEPEEPFHKCALADLLDDFGKPDLAYALRWCAARGRHPLNLSGRWGWLPPADDAPNQPERLPYPVWRECPAPPPLSEASAWDAFRRLAGALQVLRAIVSLDGPPAGG